MNGVYECARCGNCCRWPGPVYVSEAEIRRIARFLDIDRSEFKNLYIRAVDCGKALSLSEKLDGSCVLLDGNRCKVHEVKPEQCRDFPNKWNFDGFKELCGARLV